jgi:hypothetical protein
LIPLGCSHPRAAAVTPQCRSAGQRRVVHAPREVVAEYVEFESGKGADALDRRPKLAEAPARARKAKAPFCRLSRDVAFISGLGGSGHGSLSAGAAANDPKWT